MSKDNIKISIEYGSSEWPFREVEKGSTVETLRDDYICHFGIPGDAQAIISGSNVKNNHILQEGETITFRKITGRKGA